MPSMRLPIAAARTRILAAFAAAALLALPMSAAAQSPEAKAAYDEGLRFKRAKNHQAALGAFQRASQLNPKYAAAYTEAGNSQLALGEAKGASESFSRALQLDPSDQTARYNLAYTLRQLKRHDEAAKQYQIYLERSPDDADAHYGLAESLKAAGAYLAAAEAYEAYAKAEKRPTWKKWVAKARTEAAKLREKAQTAPPTAPTVSTAPVVAAAAPKAKPTTGGAKPAAPTTTAQPSASGVHLSFAQPSATTPAATTAAPSAEAPAPAPTAAATPAPASARPEAFQAGLERLRMGDYAAALTRLKIAASEAPEDSMVLAAIAGSHLGLRQAEKAEAAYRRALAGASGAAVPALYLGLGESLRLQEQNAGARSAYQSAADHADCPADVQRISRERIASLN